MVRLGWGTLRRDLEPHSQAYPADFQLLPRILLRLHEGTLPLSHFPRVVADGVQLEQDLWRLSYARAKIGA